MVEGTSENPKKTGIIKLNNTLAQKICVDYSEGLWSALKKYGLFIKGGTARNALLEYLGLPNEGESRDIDLCIIYPYTDLNNLPTVKMLNGINPKVEAIENCQDLNYFMRTTDFSLNQALIGYDGIYTTKQAISDAINRKLRLTDTYKTIRGSMRALLFLSRYDLEPTEHLTQTIKNTLSSDIEDFSFQLLITLLKSIDIGSTARFMRILGKFGFKGEFAEIFIKCLLLAWDFDLKGKDWKVARALRNYDFDISQLTQDEKEEISRSYPEFYDALISMDKGDYMGGAIFTLGPDKVKKAIGEIDLPEEKADILNYARILKINRLVK